MTPAADLVAAIEIPRAAGRRAWAQECRTLSGLPCRDRRLGGAAAVGALRRARRFPPQRRVTGAGAGVGVWCGVCGLVARGWRADALLAWKVAQCMTTWCDRQVPIFPCVYIS